VTYEEAVLALRAAGCVYAEDEAAVIWETYADPAARARWEALTASARFQHLLRLHDTKRPETRARRIAEIRAGT